MGLAYQFLQDRVLSSRLFGVGNVPILTLGYYFGRKTSRKRLSALLLKARTLRFEVSESNSRIEIRQVVKVGQKKAALIGQFRPLNFAVRLRGYLKAFIFPKRVQKVRDFVVTDRGRTV